MIQPSDESRHAEVATDACVSPSVHIGRAVSIGAATSIAAGAYLGDGVRLGARVRVGGNATFVDACGKVAGAVVADDAFIGAGATIEAGISIATKARVQAGAVVTRPVPPGAIVEGNPAQIVGYVGAVIDGRAANGGVTGKRDQCEHTAVCGVTIHHFPVIPDMRGSLTVGEFEKQIPFLPRRYFMVFGVPSREVRGEHAHLECHQFLICVKGSCAVVADDGTRRIEVILDSPNTGIYLPPMTWGVQYKYSADAVLLVFASHHYDASDYVRDYDEFVAKVNATRKGIKQ